MIVHYSVHNLIEAVHYVASVHVGAISPQRFRLSNIRSGTYQSARIANILYEVILGLLAKFFVDVFGH